MQERAEKRQTSKHGNISHEDGNALMRLLHKISGAFFAAGLPENTRLADALETFDAMTFSQPHKHRSDGSGRPMNTSIEDEPVYQRLGDA